MKTKQLTDRNGKTITAGSVVRYQGGHYGVKSVSVAAGTVNLTGVFDTARIRHKGVAVLNAGAPDNEVVEDRDAWYAGWQQSETYQCM